MIQIIYIDEFENWVNEILQFSEKIIAIQVSNNHHQEFA